MAHFFRYYALLFVVFISLAFNTQAESIDKKLWKNALNTYQSTKQKLQDNYQINDVSQILSAQCEIDWSNRYEVAALEAQASAFDNTYGLEFRAGYTSQNIEHSVNDDDGSTYMELSWDVLRNGLRENQYKATDLKRQAAIQKLSGKIKKQTLDYQCRRYRVGTYFEGMEAYLNLLKLEFMESIYQVENQAYFSGESYLDELLVSEEDIMLARQNLERLHNSSFEYKNPATLANPPVINVDLQALLKQIDDNQEFVQIRKLKNLQLQDESQYNESFLNGSRFRLFVRKEYDLARTGSDEIVAGLRFQVPIVFSQSGSQTESRLNQLENDLNHEQWEIKTRTQAAYQSLQEQLERTTKQQYRLMRANEKMRRVESYLAMEKPLDIAAVNVRLRNYIDSAIELIQAKEELYRRVNEMFLVSRVAYNPRFIKINQLNETTYRARVGERSAYLWSDDFNQYSNQQLSILLATKGIRHVMLSGSSKVKQAKRFQFLKDAKKHKLIVSHLIGEANWALSENHDKALAAIEMQNQYGNNIHLDIEPHTLKTYKNNETEVLNQYISLLEKVRTRHPLLNLSVSVPHHWPTTTYQSMADYVDQVYLMAYGNDSLDIISQRVKKLLETISVEKLIVVLRQQEFANELELEHIVNGVMQSTGVFQFAVHKLDIYTQE